ncbi:MAG: glutaredoxin family protein [Desulforhabdus sp.]|jgi:glutaredoxin-like protein NrdH|nr:glutaredoxin family protein [Desulforhabdus sp.]
MKECDIKLYALSTCIHCRNTKELLDDCGVKYDCIEVDKLEKEQRDAILEEIKKINPSCSFPTLIVGDKIIVGFKKEEIREALKE